MACALKNPVLLLCLFLLTGCDQAANYAAAQYLKVSLKETCGQQDAACIAAVETQFDPCHLKYKQHWDAYMNAIGKKEDEYLATYSINMYACIVDKDGKPYFVYNPDAV